LTIICKGEIEHEFLEKIVKSQNFLIDFQGNKIFGVFSNGLLNGPGIKISELSI